jgi:aryl-alcohol dehydrogenase-like predicted oxidoreductase
MQYSRLGESGLIVSKIAFGAMTFGAGDIPGLYKVDQDLASTLVDYALDQGVNFFDTANVYAAGQSEEILGRALGTRRKDAVVATKVGIRMGDAPTSAGLSRRHIHESIDESLRRLGTDWVDLYIAHRPDPYTPLEEALAALDEVVRMGKARYVGFSNWPAWLAAKAVTLQKERGYAPFVNAQMYYSLVGRDIEAEVVPFALDAGVGITVWSPLASGFLSGKYTRARPEGDGGRLNHINFVMFDRERGYEVVDILARVAEESGTNSAAAALAWTMSRPAVSSILVGATSLEQLQKNMAATDVRLSDDAIQLLDDTSVAPLGYPGWYNAMSQDADVKRMLE